MNYTSEAKGTGQTPGGQGNINWWSTRPGITTSLLPRHGVDCGGWQHQQDLDWSPQDNPSLNCIIIPLELWVMSTSFKTCLHDLSVKELHNIKAQGWRLWMIWEGINTIRSFLVFRKISVALICFCLSVSHPVSPSVSVSPCHTHLFLSPSVCLSDSLSPSHPSTCLY